MTTCNCDTCDTISGCEWKNKLPNACVAAHEEWGDKCTCVPKEECSAYEPPGEKYAIKNGAKVPC